LADIDKATLIEALNASKIAKQSDFAQLAAALGKEFKNAGQAVSETAAKTAGDTTTGAGKAILDKVGAVTGGLVDAFTNIGGKAMDVNLRLSDVANAGGAFSKTMIGQVLGLENLGKAADIAGDAFGSLLQYAEKNVDVWRDLSGVGASFSNDAIGMDVAAKQARLGLGDFAGIVKENSANFARLGGTVQSGAKVFTDFSQAFHESGAQSELLQMGMNEKEINQLLIDQIAGTRGKMRLDDASRAEQLQSAKGLAFEMDAMSRLTGKSRAEQQEMLKAQKQDAQTQAAIFDAIKTGGPGVSAAFDRVKIATSTVGPELGKLVSGVVAAGQLSANATAEQQAMYAQLGAESRGLLAQASVAAKAGKADEAEKLTQAALVAASRSKEFEQATQRAKMGEESGQMLSKNLMDLRITTDKMEADMKAAGINTADSSAVSKFMLDTAKKEAQARTGPTAVIVGAEDQMTKFSAAMAEKVIAPLNEKVGPGLLKFYDETLKGMAKKGAPGFEAATPVDRPVKPVEAARAEVERVQQPFASTSVDPALQRMVTGETRDVISAAVKTLITGGVKIGDAVLNSTNVFIGGKPIPGRQTGTLGMTGGLFEDFGAGSLAMLHGKESVMTEKQMADLVTNAKATGSNQTMQQMMQQALSSVKGTKADNQRTVSTDTDQSSKLQTTDLSRLLENTVNSVKGVSGLSTKMSDQLSSLSQAIVSNKDKSSQTVNPPSTSDTSTSSNASASPSAAELASVFSAAKPVAPTVPSAAELASVFSAAKPVAPAAPVPVPAKPVAETKTIMPARSDASLNDVVASLNQLNSKMGQLLDSHTDIGNKQLRAVQSNNANLFAR
jgi:hypothetical protein